MNLLQVYLSPPQKRRSPKLFLNLVKLLKVTTVSANSGIKFFHINNLYTVYSSPFPAKIIMDKARNRSKGFGYVSFAKEDEAQRALTDMNGKARLHDLLFFFVCLLYLKM